MSFNIATNNQYIVSDYQRNEFHSLQEIILIFQCKEYIMNKMLQYRSQLDV